MPTPPDGSAPKPLRVMGFRDLVLFYVVTGISLRWIAAGASIGPSSILIWIGAWLFFYVPLALSVIELSSRYPAEGGLYVWTKKAFGEGLGFIAAWTYWNSNLPDRIRSGIRRWFEEKRLQVAGEIFQLLVNANKCLCVLY